jgi:mycoredoxin
VSHLTCQFIFNSSQQPAQPPSSGFAVDLAKDPHAAHQLIKLGISPRKDLPVVLMTDAAGKLRVIGLRLSVEEAERIVRGKVPPTDRVLMFSASWCPECKSLKKALEETGLAYEEIDLDLDIEAEALVLERSGGRRVVPTLQFDDRLFVFNPDGALLSRILSSAAAQASA